MKNDFFLCVDVGQSRLKLAIYDSKLVEKENISTELSTIEKKEGYAERNMNELWEIFIITTRKILKKIGSESKKIKYLCITAHGDGCFPIDKHGKSIRNAIISIDTRAREISSKINKKYENELLKLTGQLSASNNPAILLKWLKKNEIKTVKKTKWFLCCKDWLKFKLTGVISTDYSSASSGLTNVNTGNYDNEIFKLYKIYDQRLKFPKINKSNKKIGKLKDDIIKKLNINHKIEVIEGLHDVSAAMIGMGCIDQNKLLIIGGTFGINQIISKKPIIMRDSLCRMSFENNKWLNIAYTPSCSNCIDWILKITNKDIKYLKTITKKIGINKKNNIIFLPYLYGGQSGKKAFGEFRNLEGVNSKDDLILSVVESVLFNIKNQIDFLGKKFKFKKIIATGGLFKIKYLPQILSNLMNKNIYLNSDIEAGILGTAITCLSANQKRIKNFNDEARKLTVYEPKNNSDYLNNKYLYFSKILKEINNK
ncbi:FGGY family carbohydrate kinase [Pelagibacteraceae bacterium]|nr:FGGY family carbohydrate kinase [Pelagibacteraceae bacterium]